MGYIFATILVSIYALIPSIILGVIGFNTRFYYLVPISVIFGFYSLIKAFFWFAKDGFIIGTHPIIDGEQFSCFYGYLFSFAW